MAYDLRKAHFREPATIMRCLHVAGRLLAAGRLDLAPLVVTMPGTPGGLPPATTPGATR